MSIIIFGDSFSFPEGDAATNRVHTYAKGLFENGKNVHVICFRSDYHTFIEGIINGISFYHPFGQRERNKYFIVRRWQKLLKYFKTINLLRKLNKLEKVEAIIFYGMFLSTHLFAWLLSQMTKSKLIIESSEHPLRLYQKNALKRKQGLIKLKIQSSLCDGIFCISKFLINLYQDHGVNQSKLFLLPSTVDPARFLQTGDKPFSFPYIGYFGGLTFKRDNIDVLIKAFSILEKNHPEVYLVLGGFCSDLEKHKIKKLTLTLNISNKIILLKYLTREEIIRYIIHSQILVMVRSDVMRSQASFPSKLTEYLSTSKPVITVNVGEISDYLTDGKNSFLIEPGNHLILAEKINYVLNNYEHALEIAARGKQLTKTVFNYNYQAKRMIQFIETL